MKRYGKTAMVLAAGVVAAMATGSMQARAQDAGTEPVILSGSVAFLTDYRLRGASLSDNKPVLQGVVSAKIPVTGVFSLYGGVWGSSLDKDAGAGAIETDFFGGVQADIGDVNIRARYLRLVFHDIDDLDFDQYEFGINAPVGPVNAGAGVIHDEYNGGGHSTYVYGSARYAVPDTGLAFRGLLGYEDGTNWNNKVNWQLGAFYTYKAVTFGIDYVDTNRYSANSRGGNRAKGAALFSISAAF
jgi:uncharacterized protein (TIGR02001 family)